MQHEARFIQLSTLKGPDQVVIEFVLFHLLLLRRQLAPDHGFTKLCNRAIQRNVDAQLRPKVLGTGVIL